MLNAKEYELLYGKDGIEIGGPSHYFNGGLLPLYQNVKSLDNSIFSAETIWHGKVTEGNTFNFAPGKTGYQYICDATDMQIIPTGKYDFLVSTNTLEHIANPLKAMFEFLRVIKPNGMILLVLPDKDSNFDHLRKITLWDHIKYDYDIGTKEDDLSHLGEELLLHDLPMTPECGDLWFFTQRSLKNYENRCLHQHVFDMELLKKVFDFCKLKVIREDKIHSDYIIFGKK